MKSYSTALVFSKVEVGGKRTSYSLRTIIHDANSEEEAIGKAIVYLQKEMNGHLLMLSSTTEIIFKEK